MKAICFESVGKVAMREIPDPTIEDSQDAIVRVELAGLCGSDLHPFLGREVGLDPGTAMGHEFVGEVVEIGSSVKSITIGQRVFAPFSTSCGRCFYCQIGLTSRCVSGQLFGWRQNGRGLHGGQAEYVRVPLAEGTLKPIPNGLSAASALLLGDNFSTGYFCAEMAGVRSGGTYAVIGCGTVGLMAIIAARSMQASHVVAIDTVAERREHAEKLGAISATPESAEQVMAKFSDGRGADAVLELVGLPAAQKLAYQLIRPGGTMSVIGCHCTEHFAFSPVAAYDKNLVYKTGRCPARHYMDQLSERVAAGEFTLDAFITHQFEMSDCVEAYDVFSNRRHGCLKAAFVMPS
ncbi:MAG: alcohol dehydrogenase catalytic domain-containing protein [Pirellulaceae bacterium]|nr:alcohol dehydrogenase catalytic domain-containing protein [Pirellulaceae bacterium]